MKHWRRHNAKKEAREHALANSALSNGDVKKWHAHEMKAHRAGKHSQGRHGGGAVNIPMGPPPLADGGAPIVVADQENIPPIPVLGDGPPVVVPPSAATVPGLPPSLPADNNFGFPPPKDNTPIVMPSGGSSNNGPIVVPPGGGSTGPIVVPPSGGSSMSGMPPAWPPAGGSRSYGNYQSSYQSPATFPMGAPPATQSMRGCPPSGGIPVLGADQDQGNFGGPPPGAIPILGGDGGDSESINIRDDGDKIEVNDNQQPIPTLQSASQEFTVLPSVYMPSQGPTFMPAPSVMMPPPVVMPPPLGFMPPSVVLSEPGMPFAEEIMMRPFPNAGMRLAGEPIVVQEWGGTIDATVEASYWSEHPTLAGTEVIGERALVAMPPPGIVEETTVLPPMPVGAHPPIPIVGAPEVIASGPPMPMGMPPAPMQMSGRAQLPPRQMSASPIPSGPPKTFTSRDLAKNDIPVNIPIMPPSPMPPTTLERGRDSPVVPSQQNFRGEGMRGPSPLGDQSHFAPIPILDDARGNNMNMNSAMPQSSSMNGMNGPITGPPGSTPFPISGSSEFDAMSSMPTYLPPKYVDINGNDIDPAASGMMGGGNDMMGGGGMMGGGYGMNNAQQMQMQSSFPMQNQPPMMMGGGSRGSPSDFELRTQTPIGIPMAPSPRGSDTRDSRTFSSVGGTLTRDDISVHDTWGMPVPTVPFRGSATPPPPRPDTFNGNFNTMSAAYPAGQQRFDSFSDSGSVRSARSARSSSSVNASAFR